MASLVQQHLFSRAAIAPFKWLCALLLQSKHNLQTLKSIVEPLRIEHTENTLKIESQVIHTEEQKPPLKPLLQ